MREELISDGKDRTFVIVFDTGDEVVSGLEAFARKHRIDGARLTAIGAVSEASVGFFDWRKRTYKRSDLREQMDVLSLLGYLTIDEQGNHKVDVQAVFSCENGTVRGGHLIAAKARPTLEVMAIASTLALHQRLDPSAHVPVIDANDPTPIM